MKPILYPTHAVNGLIVLSINQLLNLVLDKLLIVYHYLIDNKGYIHIYLNGLLNAGLLMRHSSQSVGLEILYFSNFFLSFFSFLLYLIVFLFHFKNMRYEYLKKSGQK